MTFKNIRAEPEQEKNNRLDQLAADQGLIFAANLKRHLSAADLPEAEFEAFLASLSDKRDAA